MTLRAVIFDLGGVLLRTEDHAPRQRLAERLGMTYNELCWLVFESESARLATLGKISAQAHWEAVRAALHLTPEQFVTVPAEFWGGDALDADLVDYIRNLHHQHRTALLSNAWDDLRQALNREFRIADAFDEVIISAEVGLAKPDPRIYWLALECLGVTPSEAVFVDDFPENVAGARAVGLHAIQFRHPAQARQELNRLLNSQHDIS